MKYILVILVSMINGLSFSQFRFSDYLYDMYESLSDSNELRSYFHDYAEIVHIDTDTTYGFDLNNFLGICQKFESGQFREEIIKIEIGTEEPLGLFSADVYFKFYLNGEFSHCGIDHHLWTLDNGNFGVYRIYSYEIPCKDEEPIVGPNPNINSTVILDNLMDKWHSDVANYDFDAYFGFMDDSFIFLGTDPNERWSKSEFAGFSKPYFEKGSTWDFTPLWRNWYFSEDGNTAWFEEQLDTWMEECRGSGVLKKVDGQWKIVHYNLTVLIENEKIKKFIKLRKK